MSQKQPDRAPIAPVEIIHSADIVPAGHGEDHGESYNYLDYLFAGDGLVARARSYLDEIGTVVLHGPDPTHGKGERPAGTDFEAGIIAYLKLRYRRIERLDPTIRTGRPYALVWQDDAEPG